MAVPEPLLNPFMIDRRILHENFAFNFARFFTSHIFILCKIVFQFHMMPNAVFLSNHFSKEYPRKLLQVVVSSFVFTTVENDDFCLRDTALRAGKLTYPLNLPNEDR